MLYTARTTRQRSRSLSIDPPKIWLRELQPMSLLPTSSHRDEIHARPKLSRQSLPAVGGKFSPILIAGTLRGLGLFHFA